jgi:hypothetical protein
MKAGHNMTTPYEAAVITGARSGLGRADGQRAWLDLAPDGEDALTQLQGASIRYRIAVGPIAGRKTLRLHTPGAALEGPEHSKPFTGARDGFSLDAALTCRAEER